MTSPSAYTSWFVGMKVVCVKQGHWRYSSSNELADDIAAPVCGEVYTIRTIGLSQYGRAHVRLKEIVNPIRDYANGRSEAQFIASHFRPVQVRKTSIAIFERIRDNPKAPIIEPSPKQRERV